MSTKTLLLPTILSRMQKEENCILLWTGRQDSENFKSLLFLHPEDILVCRRQEDIPGVFDKIQTCLKKGLFVTGYITYEAGYAFEESLKNLIPPGGILMWLGVYRRPAIFKAAPANLSIKTNHSLSRQNYELIPLGLDVSERQYQAAIAKIKNYIAQGQTYQVNYTIKKYFNLRGSPYALFSQLCRNQEVSYAALIKNDYEYILSLSPELFFRLHNGALTVRPMKGTVERGKSAQEDYARAFSLKAAPKERAENVMIVDLLRNDLGRVSQTGSVKTKSLFDAQRLNTIWQMTSTVTSRLKGDLSCYDIFANIFPSGSVTGAPKIRTMGIINELEHSARGVYTGAIGYLGPQQEGAFNVAIRTLHIDRKSKKCELGIGSGIVWDSQATKEWQECQAKSLFLHDGARDFQLIETMALKKGRVFLLDYHLERLEESAYYFNFNFQRSKALNFLRKFIRKLNPGCDYKLRLLLFPDGSLMITPERLKHSRCRNPKVVFAIGATSSQDIFLYHKTTRRHLYTLEHTRCRQRGYFDCIFKNEKGQITEGAISNIFIERGSKLFTPALSCGLLNGVYRRYLCALSPASIKERILYEDDLFRADKIYLTNAVSGIIRVNLDRDN